MNTGYETMSDKDKFFISINREEIITSIKSLVQNRAGTFILTGDEGTGKSLFSRVLPEYLPDVTVIRLDKIYDTEDELLRDIGKQIDIEMSDSHIFELLLDRLRIKLIEMYKDGVNILLIVDHLDKLSSIILDAILVIGDLSFQNDKLIQIMLISDYEGIRLIKQKELEHVDLMFKRVLDLKALNIQECKPFIIKIFRKHGLITDDLSDADVDLIYRYANGSPQKMDRLIEHALLAGGLKQTPDKSRLVEAAESLGFVKVEDSESIESSGKAKMIAGVAVAVFIVAGIGIKLMSGGPDVTPVSPTLETMKVVELVDNKTEVAVVSPIDNITEPTVVAQVTEDKPVVAPVETESPKPTTEPVRETKEEVSTGDTDRLTTVDVVPVTQPKTVQPVIETDSVELPVEDNNTEVAQVKTTDKEPNGRCVRLKKNLNFRVSPDINAERINVLAAETAYRIIDETDFWVKVEYNEVEGWLYKSMKFLEMYECD